ncbi:MAG: MFS transporter [Proteobacteria bacterium]|nr:MFS transporter [Pseudomonadota bacterium]
MGTKVAHGVGAMAFAAKDASFANFVPFFYTQVVGLSGTLVGWAAFAGQLSDAITDPIFGSLSDNHRSRWGRRHPFMVAAAIPLALCFPLLFSPPTGWSPWALCAWLAFVAIGLRTLLTMFAIPHVALGAELSSDYEERSLIASYRALMGWLAGVALPAVGLLWLFAKADDGSDGRLVASNYAHYAWMSAGVVLVSIAVTTYFTRKEIPHLPGTGERRRFDWRAPIRDVRQALQNRNFRWLFAALLFIGASSGVVVSLGYYANVYFWEFSSSQVAVLFACSVVGVGIGFALLRPLVKRFEKKSLVYAALVTLVANGCWWPGARLLEWLPENGHPILFPLAILNSIVLSGSAMMIQTLGASIVADIVDEHEVETGERSEGVFFAAMGFSMKIPTGIGQLVGGILYDVIGLEPGLQPGEVAPDVLFQLGLIAGPVMSLTFLIPGLILTRYRLDRVRHAALRAILDRRASADGA